jgi:hypothetical protein
VNPPSEREALFDELDVDASFGQIEHNLAQIIKIPSQAIHGVAGYRIALANEGKQ